MTKSKKKPKPVEKVKKIKIPFINKEIKLPSLKPRKKVKYEVRSKVKLVDIEKEKEKQKINKFYWSRAIAGIVFALLGVFAFRLIGWWMFIYMMSIGLALPWILSFLVFRYKYEKDKWDWKAIMKHGVGPYFFLFLLISTMSYTLVTLPQYRDIFRNPADTNDLYIDGNMMYVANGEHGFVIMELEGPNNRLWKSTYETEGSVNLVHVEGSTAFIVDSIQGLLILDISDPTAPELLNSNSSFVNTNKIITNGSVAYFANPGYGMLIYDISTPAAIQQIGSFNTTSNNKVTDIDLKDDLVYISVENQGLYLVNVTIPSSLEIVNTIIPDTLGSLNVVIEENICYMARGATSNTSFVQSYNITNTSNPILLNTPRIFNGIPREMRLANSSLIIATGDFGLSFVNVTNATNLEVYHNYYSYGFCSDVELWGDIIFSAEGYRGIDYMSIFNLKITTEPKKASSKKTISFGWTWLGLIMISIPILAIITKKRLSKS